jgi:hypothetical protein|tara:strand:- start:440 stop:1276 length:837 start_codon:yes stop_codon:yes gene_type:complete
MGSVTKSIFGSKPKAGKPMAGAQFQPYSYKSLVGDTTGTRTKDGFNFETNLSPELQSLYGTGLNQAQPFLSQYLNQAQKPIDRFGYTDDVRAREQQIFSEQAALLQPELLQQQTQMQNNLFGSGRLGLQLAGGAAGAGAGAGMVNPDAYGLGLAQSRAIAELAPQARIMAQQEQELGYDQALNTFLTNREGQQQLLQNLGMGYEGAFGTVGELYNLESALTAQSAGLEEARARAAAGSSAAGTPPTAGSGGMFGAALTAAAGSFGSPVGAAAAGALLK